MSRSHHTEILTPAQWRIYRELRLQALQESPDAFGSTFALEAPLTAEAWESRLEAAASSGIDLPLVAFLDQRPAGLAWARRDTADPLVVNLFQMWVAPECRRHGIGRELIERAASWARDLSASTLQLKVTVANSAAYRLYLSTGFRAYGEPEPLREGSALLTHTMRLSLRDGPAA